MEQRSTRRNNETKTVLVGVIRRRRDLSILLRERWYRIPRASAPRRRFRYLALYQPALFGRGGRCIRYYARVLGRRIVKRIALLPDEPRHPRANEPYIWLRLGAIRKLPRPIRNTTPRRVSFGFTTLDRLRSARNLLELYNIPPTETVMARMLRRAGISAVPQYRVSVGGKTFRLDFAISRVRKKIAIECDNRKAHAGAAERKRDRAKDAFLRRRGWIVIRFTDRDILSRNHACVARVRRAINQSPRGADGV